MFTWQRVQSLMPVVLSPNHFGTSAGGPLDQPRLDYTLPATRAFSIVVRTRDGKAVRRFAARLADYAGTPSGAFRWVEGESRELALEANEVAQVGELMARLHDHAATFACGLRPNRRAYDGDDEAIRGAGES